MPELSGLILVLLDWDEKRQDMASRFIAMNVPIIVFVVMDKVMDLDPGPLNQHPDRFIPIAADDVQETLDNVNWSNL